MEQSIMNHEQYTLKRDWYLLPNNQRQHRTLHSQQDVLPYAFCV